MLEALAKDNVYDQIKVGMSRSCTCAKFIGGKETNNNLQFKIDIFFLFRCILVL